jgi:hypothetical protein
MQKQEPVFSGAINLPPTDKNERRGATIGTLKLYNSQADLERFPNLPAYNGFLIIENPHQLKVKEKDGKKIVYLYVSVWEKGA